MSVFTGIGKFLGDNLKSVIGVIVSGILITVVTVAYQSSDFYKTTVLIPVIEENAAYIKQEKLDNEKKSKDIAVGLRYNTEKEKFYWRDAHKDCHPIYTDSIGTFYRNSNDKKVYIKFEEW